MVMIFVGEKPSRKAFNNGLSWKDGKLAAKTLFDALRAMDIDPSRQVFINLFGDHPDSPECCHWDALVWIRAETKGHPRATVVALGSKVSRLLAHQGVEHVPLVHPAARGSIRRREAYIAHVMETLKGRI